MKKFSLILASDSKNGIGLNGTLPWKISKDMKYFKKITILTEDPSACNALLMGRKTWDSIPEKFRPLPGRVNCVLSRNAELKLDGAQCFTSIDDCLKALDTVDNIEKIFVIGGAQIYNSLLSHENLEKIYLTSVEGDFKCDTFFDGIPENFQLSKYTSIQEENGIEFQFTEYTKKEG